MKLIERRFSLTVISIFIILFILTNRWTGWEEGKKYFYGEDVQQYIAMAQVAPNFYHDEIRFHIAQRFFPSFCVGILSKVAQIEISTSFTLLSICCALLIIYCMHQIFIFMDLSPNNYALCMSLVVLNPYLFRFHANVHGSLQGLMFILGTTVTILGLLKGRLAIVILAIIFSTLSRQTTLLMLPGIIVWMFAGSKWKEKRIGVRLGNICSVILAIFITFILTSQVASLSISESRNWEHLYGIIVWIKEQGFNLRIFLELCMRCVMPHLLPLTMIFSIFIFNINNQNLTTYPVEVWATILISLAIISQPILAGPILTGLQNGSGTRLGMMGLVSTFTALGLVMQNTIKWPVMVNLRANCLFFMAIVLGSMHHTFGSVGPNSVIQFAMLNFFAAFLLSFTVFFNTYHRRFT